PLCTVCFHATAPTGTSLLSLHDALPICHRAVTVRGRGDLQHARERRFQRSAARRSRGRRRSGRAGAALSVVDRRGGGRRERACRDRKSTRLNSSHVKISYAVFCLKKKRK